MIRATIVTPYRRYEFEVPAEHAESVALAHDWLENQIYGVDEGCIQLPGRVIDIRHPDDVRSLEVWEEVLQLSTGGLVNLASVNISDEGPGEMAGEIPYLGQNLQLRLLTYRLRGYFYAMPQEINGGPAQEVLDHVALGQVAEQFLQREGIGGTVILPPVHIEIDQEAASYVMDYAEQATPPAYFAPGDKTARAAGGIWNEK